MAIVKSHEIVQINPFAQIIQNVIQNAKEMDAIILIAERIHGALMVNEMKVSSSLQVHFTYDS